MNTSIVSDLVKNVGKPVERFTVVGLYGLKIQVHVLLLRKAENLPLLLLHRGVAVVQKEWRNHKFFPMMIQLFDSIDHCSQQDVPILEAVNGFRSGLRLLENSLELDNFYDLVVCLSDRMQEVIAFAEKNNHQVLCDVFKKMHMYGVQSKRNNLELRVHANQTYLG